MSTHSRIGILFDGNIEHVYCHFDGYPEYMLTILTQNYADETQAFELVALGNLSFVGTNINETEAYCRDRKESWFSCHPIQGDTIQEFKQKMEEEHANHGYLFDCDKGVWTHITR
ncbi:MAG: hypothetical protein DSY80_07120 [Desulfocapsa sp.]|nr:MAG: hypothetical protein DSY80_07120 [Desulfocapsa sp.]